MEFGSIYGMRYKKLKVIPNVYNDMLGETFKRMTGLYLRLAKEAANHNDYLDTLLANTGRKGTLNQFYPKDNRPLSDVLSLYLPKITPAKLKGDVFADGFYRILQNGVELTPRFPVEFPRGAKVKDILPQMGRNKGIIWAITDQDEYDVQTAPRHGDENLDFGVYSPPKPILIDWNQLKKDPQLALTLIQVTNLSKAAENMARIRADLTQLKTEMTKTFSDLDSQSPSTSIMSLQEMCKRLLRMEKALKLAKQENDTPRSLTAAKVKNNGNLKYHVELEIHKIIGQMPTPDGTDLGQADVVFSAEFNLYASGMPVQIYKANRVKGRVFNSPGGDLFIQPKAGWGIPGPLAAMVSHYLEETLYRNSRTLSKVSVDLTPDDYRRLLK